MMMRGHGNRLLTFLLLAMLLPLANPAAAAGPDLRLRPNDGLPGESVVVRGRDFAAGSSGQVTWEWVTEPLAEFTADDSGEFEITITVPDLTAGTYLVTASSGSETADDAFVIEAADESEVVETTPMPEWMSGQANFTISQENLCDTEAGRAVPVANAAELTSAMDEAMPGDRIVLADGIYSGNFVIDRSGTEPEPIAICGSRLAELNGGGWGQSGYALHITADYLFVGGITVTNAQKGIVLDEVSHVVLHSIEVHTTGHEAVHFRTHSTDNVIALSDLHDTGLDNEKFGEGIYIGSAVSNWSKYSGGDPDRSDRNQVLGNRIWATSSESIDLKEGTEAGLVEGNLFDGSGMSGADSWVDAKGNGYVIKGNTGVNAPQDGFQTHVIDNMEWGTSNIFEGNHATVNAGGFGFYIHQPDDTTNIVRCDNIVLQAQAISNLAEPCSS